MCMELMRISQNHNLSNANFFIEIWIFFFFYENYSQVQTQESFKNSESIGAKKTKNCM